MSSHDSQKAGESSTPASESISMADQSKTAETKSDMTSFTSLGVDPPTVEEETVEAKDESSTQAAEASEAQKPTFWKRMSGGFGGDKTKK